MKQDQNKIGSCDIDPEEFAPKNRKHRVTTFIDGDLLDWLKAEAARMSIGYQTLLNMKLRESMDGGSVKEEVRTAFSDLLKELAKESPERSLLAAIFGEIPSPRQQINVPPIRVGHPKPKRKRA